MTTKPKGLGRGLNALFEDEENTRFDEAAMSGATTPDARISGQTGRMVLGIDQLEPGASQPRKIFHTDTLSELADSIRMHGVLQPLLVRAKPNAPSRYEIIAGERRWRAAQMAKLHEVPVIVKELSDEDAMEIALIENLQREDLNPVDEAMGYKRLMDNHKYTQDMLARSLGKSRSYIANMVRLLALSDVVLAYLERGDLSIGHARALVTSDNQDALARQIVEQKLSVRDTEKLVNNTGGQDTNPSDKTSNSARTGQGKTANNAAAKDVNIKALEDDLSGAIGMRVSINAGANNTGQMTIAYQSLDQLDMMIAKIKS